MITLERLKEILEENFTAPFVTSEVLCPQCDYKFPSEIEVCFVGGRKEKTLEISIERRFVWIDESGQLVGMGRR